MRLAGKEVHLANLSFSHLGLTGRDAWLVEDVAADPPDIATADRYFPERTLARWLAAQQCRRRCTRSRRSASSRCGRRTGSWSSSSGIDAVVLVDGGTDILHARRREQPGHAGGGHDQPRRRGRAGRTGEAGDLPGLRHRRLRRRQPRPGAGEPRRARPRRRLPRRAVHSRRQPGGAALPRRRRGRPGRHPAATQHRPGPDRRRHQRRVRGRPVHQTHRQRRPVRQPADGDLLHRRSRQTRGPMPLPRPHREHHAADGRSSHASKRSATSFSAHASPALSRTDRPDGGRCGCPWAPTVLSVDAKTAELRAAHDVLAELYAERLADALDRMPAERAVLDLFCVRRLPRGGAPTSATSVAERAASRPTWQPGAWRPGESTSHPR